MKLLCINLQLRDDHDLWPYFVSNTIPGVHQVECCQWHPHIYVQMSAWHQCLQTCAWGRWHTQLYRNTPIDHSHVCTMYLDLHWNRGRIWCRPGPRTFQGHSDYIHQVLGPSLHQILPRFQRRSLSATSQRQLWECVYRIAFWRFRPRLMVQDHMVLDHKSRPKLVLDHKSRPKLPKSYRIVHGE